MISYGNHMASIQIKNLKKNSMSYWVEIKTVGCDSQPGCSDFHLLLNNERTKTRKRKQRKKKKPNYCFQQYN